MKTSLSRSELNIIKKQKEKKCCKEVITTELHRKEGSDFFLSFTQRIEPKTKTECSAVVSVHYTVGLHTHVPFLITQAHVVMMRSAQGSDVIWLKGI